MIPMDDLTLDSESSLGGLSVRDAQGAIAERLGVGAVPTDTDADASSETDADDSASAAAALADDMMVDDMMERDEPNGSPDGNAGKPARTPVYDAAQQAEHARLVEALLFAAAEAMTLGQLAQRLPHGADVAGALEALQQQYENRGVNLQVAGGRYRFVTNPALAYVLTEERVETRRLSRAAMETLAVIAYHQPCTRADIEDVRGVAVSKGSLDQLLEIGWIKLAGRRKDAPGRPVLYATTPEFLAHFDLASVGDLPGMADLRAAGLLDANLPPGFAVPTPSASAADAGDDEVADGDEEDAPEFVRDFHEPGDAVATSDGVQDPETPDLADISSGTGDDNETA